MRPDVARRPSHVTWSRFASALLSALLLVGVVAVPSPQSVLASTPMATACDGVRLRTGPSTSDPLATPTTLTAGTPVGVDGTIAGGTWSVTCAVGPTTGSDWHRIVDVNGQSVSALYGVPYVYAATGLFGPAVAPTPTPTPDPFATPTPTPDPFATPTPTPTPSPTPYTPVLEGIDVSHWQGAIDWPLVAASGKRFVYLKASESTDLVDEFYATNRAQAKALGLYVGAYHFARPDRTPGDAVAEADYFLAMAQPVAGDLLPVLDLERTADLTSAELQDWVRSYLGRIYERTGARGVIYTAPTFWRNAMDDTTWFAANGYLTLWVAHWTSGPVPSIPGANWGGAGWTFWQYTSSGEVPGISGRVDLDRFNGTDLSSVLLTSGVIDPAGQVPTLTLTPSATLVTWGTTVVMKAAFGPIGANRSFTLQAARDGADWQVLGTLTADADGNASFSYRPSNNLYYRGVFDGAPELAAMTSNPTRVAVRQTVLLRPTASGGTKVISRGRQVTFVTTVRPRAEAPRAKVTFAFYRRLGGRWVVYKHRDVYVDSAGVASYRWTFSVRGEWYVRSYANATTVNAISAWSPIERYSVR